MSFFWVGCHPDMVGFNWVSMEHSVTEIRSGETMGCKRDNMEYTATFYCCHILKWGIPETQLLDTPS